jgi:integrase
MKGARPILDEEVQAIKEYFRTKPPHKHDNRDLTFIRLGLFIGWRCSELLSVKVKDVWDASAPSGHHISDFITCKRSNTKGKHAGKRTPIFGECKDMLESYVSQNCQNCEYLFQSVMGGPLSYRQMLRCVKKHFDACALSNTGSLSTHSLRKSFAKKMYESLKGDLPALQSALAHKSINSTVSYVSVNQDKIVESLKNLDSSYAPHASCV